MCCSLQKERGRKSLLSIFLKEWKSVEEKTYTVIRFFHLAFFSYYAQNKRVNRSSLLFVKERGNKSLSSIFSKWATREIHTQKPRSEFPTLSRIKCRGRGISRTKLHMPTPSSGCNDAEKRTSAHCLVLLLFRNSFYFLESLPDFCIAQN